MNKTYNNLLNTIEPLGKNKKNNINLKIKTRSEKYKKEINEKTFIVEELIKTMQDHIDNLKEKITNSTVFSNDSKEKMKEILRSLEESKKEGSQDFENEIKKLTDIMTILKKLIGEGNNNNPNLNDLTHNANTIRLPNSTTKNNEPKFKVGQTVKARFGPKGNAIKNFTIQEIKPNNNGKFLYSGFVKSSTTGQMTPYTLPENKLIKP